MMFKRFLVLVICLVTSFFAFAYWHTCYYDSRSAKAKMAHHIMGEVAQEVFKKYGFTLYAISEEGNKKVPGTYQELGVDFEARRAIQKDEARKILLDLSEIFLGSLNNHPNFSKHMSPYPFSLDNIKVGVISVDKEGNHQFYPNICVFYMSKGKLIYLTRTPESLENYKFHTQETETYEEALQILG